MAKKPSASSESSVYRITEVIGTSAQSWEDAARNAVETAANTLRDLRVAEVGKLDHACELAVSTERTRSDPMSAVTTACIALRDPHEPAQHIGLLACNGVMHEQTGHWAGCATSRLLVRGTDPFQQGLKCVDHTKEAGCPRA